MKDIIEISHEISLSEIEYIIDHNKKIAISKNALAAVEKCRTYLDQRMEKAGEAIYGVNTGFGSLCNTVVSNADLSTLQENLLRSHACGAGEKIDIELVKIMLLLKIQSLVLGSSGVSVETVNRLVDFFNNGIYPVVYEQGSLGASGDLAPLAHLCLPLIGDGAVWIHNGNGFEIVPAKIALAKYNWQPIKLQSKEGLALINGTQFMSAFGTYVYLKAKKLINWSNLIAATSMEGFDARIEPFHPALHDLRPHPGQIETARVMRYLLANSAMIAAPKKQVQDPYSFRCIPQVHGASWDAFQYFKTVLDIEVNAVTDNPNVFPDLDTIISGGNFHGQPLALSYDFLAIALAELGNISERRTFQLISGTRHLPAFLTANPGLNSGFMIPQYTAASIVSQNKQLATPASVDSIVSSNGQEDHVSMGANAATKLLRVCNNLETILAIEYMNAAQAIEFRRPLKSSNHIEEPLAAYREKVAKLENDRYLYTDMQETIEFMRNYALAEWTI